MTTYPESELPLHGMRVVDLGGPLAAYGVKLLADLGAEVVRVVGPGGDPLEHAAPVKDGVSLTYTYYYGDTRTTGLDIGAADAEATLAKLAADADAVIIAPRAGYLVGLDARAPSLSWAPDHAIVLCLSPFGLGGPLARWTATPLTSYAASGLMNRMGPAGEAPVAMPGRQPWDITAAHGVMVLLAAWRARAGGGQFIDLSVHDVLTAQDEMASRFSIAARVMGPGQGAGYPPNGPWTCADGQIEFQVHTDRHWAGFVAMLGDPPELTDPSYAQRLVRAREAEQLEKQIAALLAFRSRYELVERGQRNNVPCGLLNTPEQFTDDAQIRARGFIIERAHEALGTIRVPGAAFHATTPLLRSHTAGDGRAALRAGHPRATHEGGGPLAGLRALVFGNFVAGNTFAMTLAELGAEAVKVESYNRPDPVRSRLNNDHDETREPSGAETTALFAGLSRSAGDLAIDMKTPGAGELFTRLAGAADVVFENFSAGVLDRWGVGWERLSAAHPGLVMVSVSGYGRTGPRSGYLAYGGNISSFTGLTHLWGMSHGSVYDYVASIHAVSATLAALEVRDRTGQGAYIDLSQAEAAGAILGPLLLGHLNGVAGAPSGSRLTAVVRCAGEDRWLAVEAVDAGEWTRLCHLLGHDPARADASTVHASLVAWVASRTGWQAASLLQRAGVSAAPVQDEEDVWRDPQLRARSSIVPVTHPDLGTYEYAAPPPRLSRTPARVRGAAPRLGQDTRHLLADWLGMDEAQIADLVGSGVVMTDDPRP